MEEENDKLRSTSPLPDSTAQESFCEAENSKPNLPEDVGYQPDGDNHSTLVPTVHFDELAVQLGVWGIGAGDLEEADTPQKIRELLLARGVSSKVIDDWLAELQNGRAVTASKPPTVAIEATEKSNTPPTDTSGPGSRWTLPQAMGHAVEQVANYLPVTANDLGWVALGIRKMFATENQWGPPEKPEQLEKMSPREVLSALSTPGRISVAERIAAYIRLNPRSLLDPNTSERLISALVDLLETAHFGGCEHRFPGLLPEGNRKLEAKTAKDALRLLASSEPGNPPGYPPRFLSGIVGLIQVAFAPIKHTWANGNLEKVRDAFGDELQHFTDRELRSLLSDKLLVAAARLAQTATGISAESFETAWRKEPSPIFQEHLPQ